MSEFNRIDAVEIHRTQAATEPTHVITLAEVQALIASLNAAIHAALTINNTGNTITLGLAGQLLTANVNLLASFAAGQAQIAALGGQLYVVLGSSASTAAAGNHTHSAATGSVAGFLSAVDKTKLDGIATGATAITFAGSGSAGTAARSDHTHADVSALAAGFMTPDLRASLLALVAVGAGVTSVAGRTGAVVLAVADLSDSGAFGRTLVQTALPANARTALELTSAATGDAAGLTSGTIDMARLPALATGVQVISTSATIAGLSGGEQTAITAAGAVVTTTDGRRWVFKGSGIKTEEGSYIELADVTPDWSVIANKPTTFVLTTGTYADPAWITGLAWSKITGEPTTAAGYGIANGAVLDVFGSNGHAYYLARANHTGTQGWSTITGAPLTATPGVDLGGGAGTAGTISLNGGDGGELAAGGNAGTINLNGAPVASGVTGGNGGSIDLSGTEQFAGGTLNMKSNGTVNAGSIDTVAGGNLTAGTGNIIFPDEDGTIGNAAFQDEVDFEAAGAAAAAQAAAVQRANHTGTQVLSTISDVTTAGGNIAKLTNPGAIRYLRINADNTVNARSAAEMLADLGCPETLFTHFANAGNSGTSETDLYSDSIAAGKLSANGNRLEAEFAGTFVSSGTATRQIKIYFGGTAIFDSGALTLSTSSAWEVYVSIIRKDSATVRCSVSLTTQGAALAAYTAYLEVGSLTLSSANILKITGTAAGVGAASNDIVAAKGYVEFKP